MAIDLPPPQEAPPQRVATLNITLPSGKQAQIQAPADMTDQEALFMVQAVLDFWKQLNQNRPGIVLARGQVPRA